MLEHHQPLSRGVSPANSNGAHAACRPIRGRATVTALLALVVLSLGACGSGTSVSSNSASGSSTSGGTSSGSGGTSSGSGGSGGSGATSGPGTPGTPVKADQSAGVATLLLNISGTSQGVNYDYVNVAGKASLGGKLIVNFINSFAPTSGQKFVLVNAAGGISGDFASVVTNGVNVTSGKDATTYYITVN
ncbi:MAG: hypothetical protein M3O41_18620 [Pseudomonadota bacterium]|nr:hypothetical protein [Pseudomonadota bacterium]